MFRVQVINSSDVLTPVWLEPWGEDYWMPPGATFDFLAVEAGPDFYFAVEYARDRITVYAEKQCLSVTVQHAGHELPCGHGRPGDQ